MRKAFSRFRYHRGVVTMWKFLAAVFSCSFRVRVYLAVATFLALVVYINVGSNQPQFDPLPTGRIKVDLLLPPPRPRIRGKEVGDWGLAKHSVIRNNEGRIIVVPDTSNRRPNEFRKEEEEEEEAQNHVRQEIPIPPEADLAWLARRKELLNATKSRRVLVYSYALSGPNPLTTLFNDYGRAVVYPRAADPLYSSLLAYPPDSLPLDLLYYWNSMRRTPSELESRATLEYFRSLFQCNFTALPVAALQHRGMAESKALSAAAGCSEAKDRAGPASDCRQAVGPLCGQVSKHHRDMAMAEKGRCMEIIHELRSKTLKGKSTKQVYLSLSQKLARTILDPETLSPFIAHENCMRNLKKVTGSCTQFASDLCRHYSLTVATVNRLPMKALGYLLQEMPDLFVIYHPSDPRKEAIVRAQSDNLAWHSAEKAPTTEVRMLCKRMADDLLVMKKLQDKYHGAFMRLSLENLLLSPVKSASDIFKAMGREPPSKVHKWKSEAVDSVVKCHDQFGPFRCTPATYIQSWRSEVKTDLAKVMSAMCQDVLEQLGYQL